MTDELAEPPKGFKTLAKATQVGLLRTERKTLGSLRTINKTAIAAVVAAILLGASSKHAAASAVNAAATTLRDATTKAVANARTASRDLARDRVAAEIKKVNQVAGADIRIPEPGPDSSREHDIGLATAAGEAAAAGFRAVMLAAVLRRTDDGNPAAQQKAIAATAAPLDVRARRTATTEVSTAFNHEHGTALQDIGKAKQNLTWLPLLARRWDATLDGVTCATCRKHHGELALMGVNGGRFKDNREPGDVHFCCRCCSTLVVIPVAH